MTPADAPTPEKPSTSASDPPPPPRLKGWGRLRGDKAPAPAPPPQSNPPPPPKIETVQPVITVEKKMKPFALEVSSAKDTSSSSLKASSSSATTTSVIVAKSQTEQHSGPDYAHLNDRLNRIEQLIGDLMVKVDDKTRSIEKSVAKVKHAKSKHAKPHQSVTICVDSPQGAGTGTGGSNNDCDEQFL